MKFLRFLLIAACASFFFVGFVRVGVLLDTQHKIVSASELTPVPVVLVPGAGLNRNQTPSLALSDRLDTAIGLYNSGIVEKLLMSGDNSYVEYNEPGAMQRYAVEHGVPDEDIVQDYAGRRTYDSCYRAREIFGLGEVIVVTQAYHLPRAVFLCEKLGLQAQGVAAEQSGYFRDRFLFWNFREVFATLAAVWDVYVRQPLPILGEPEPIL